MAVENYDGAIDRGLEGVVACSSGVSSIVGATLCYRGYTIEEVAQNAGFEECTYLLWYNKLPNATELLEFKKDLAQDFVVSDAYKKVFKDIFAAFPKDGHPMDFLKTAVSLLSFFNKETRDNSFEANERKAKSLLSQILWIVPSFERLRKGLSLLDANPKESFAWNFLYLLNGEAPTENAEKIFNTALVLHADHGLNCSTFSTRVTASTLSDLHSAIVSAIGTLKGPLHGGANTAVLEMLQEIGSIEKVDAFVEESLKIKRKIMGIGHRVYKDGDPRAKILKDMSRRLCEEKGTVHLFEMSEKIEEAIKTQKGLLPNVDFYSATMYHALGIAGDLFTPIFALSRTAGWCAQAFEQYAANRIYRPRAKYTGETALKWVELSAR